MRRRKEVMDKLRVKILEDRKAGLTYEQIQRKRGVSSRTIAKLVKGKDPKRFCQMCGETDPEKLEEHHPDKVNRPNYTITLCASCHAKVTRKQQQKRNKEKKNQLVIPEIVSALKVPVPQAVSTQPQVRYTPSRPLTPQEKHWIGKGLCYGGGGIAIGEGMFDKRLPRWVRGLLIIAGIGLMYGGSKIKQDIPPEKTHPVR